MSRADKHLLVQTSAYAMDDAARQMPDTVRELLDKATHSLRTGNAHDALQVRPPSRSLTLAPLQPLQYVVGAVRVLGVSPDCFPALAEALAQSALIGRPPSGGTTASASGIEACVEGLAAMLSHVDLRGVQVWPTYAP
eukprot:365187-Chlamydomonas_euryale.AAC.22